MDKISTCRAAHLISFIDILRDMGAPVCRELERAKLPTSIEDTPEEFVSNILLDQFVAESERREGIDDLGWLFAKRFSATNFSAELLAALEPMPTVRARLDRFSSLSRLEDSDINIGFLKSDGGAEVFCDITPPEGMKSFQITEWAQVAAVIEVIRSVMGKSWVPDEIRFRTGFSVCDAAHESNPNTRFITQSARTSIIMPSSVLAASKLPCGIAKVPDPNIPDCLKLNGTGNLKRLIRPYLIEATPKIDMIAEIAGMSRRSLQRKLQQAGSNYSELIETARFEMATEMLRNPDIRVIDVAMTLGYADQSNFGRGFRRFAGISPGKYRREMFHQVHAH